VSWLHFLLRVVLSASELLEARVTQGAVRGLGEPDRPAPYPERGLVLAIRLAVRGLAETGEEALIAALRMAGSAPPAIHVGKGLEIGFGFISTGTSME